MRFWLLSICLLLGFVGCGTTRWTDSERTATEQLLVSDAIDRTVSHFDFSSLAGKKAYLDATALKNEVDAPYLASSIRQQMLAQRCLVMDKREDAEYVVEARSGAVGTDRNEAMFGIPETRVGSVAAIPEIPFVKKTEQRAVAKIALFAFNRGTGEGIWQSGTLPTESQKRDLWVLGVGPFGKGGFVDSAAAARDKRRTSSLKKTDDAEVTIPAVLEEASYTETLRGTTIAKEPSQQEPKKQTAESKSYPSPLEGVVAASHTEPSDSHSPPKKND
jgi:hypothetical protein